MKRFLFLGLLCAAAASAAAQQVVPQYVQLSAGIHMIRAEVANTFSTRSTGLMHRKNMPQHQGMVFVFPEAERHCMWMKNTFVPLSVAFFDAQGTILNIEDMEPQTEANHCAARPAQYALEMNKGWFAARGIKPGTRLSGVERLPPPQ